MFNPLVDRCIYAAVPDVVEVLEQGLCRSHSYSLAAAPAEGQGGASVYARFAPVGAAEKPDAALEWRAGVGRRADQQWPGRGSSLTLGGRPDQD